MTSQQILQSDLLDILFENRNKTYGAYALRKNYSTQLIKAMGYTAVFVIGLMFLGNSSKTKAIAASPKDTVRLTVVTLPEDKKVEPVKPKIQQPPAAAQPPVKTEIFHDKMQIVDNTKQVLATQTELNDALPGSVKSVGLIAGVVPPQIPSVISGNGTGDKEEKIALPLPSRQPQFPGGTDAWINFLNKHLQPPQDMEAGEKRTSLIRFSVDEEGTITNFQVIQSGGSEFDSEVIRVLKKMPKWLPAIQNGKAVAVSFTQPVTFAASEE